MKSKTLLIIEEEKWLFLDNFKQNKKHLICFLLILYDLRCKQSMSPDIRYPAKLWPNTLLTNYLNHRLVLGGEPASVLAILVVIAGGIEVGSNHETNEFVVNIECMITDQ